MQKNEASTEAVRKAEGGVAKRKKYKIEFVIRVISGANGKDHFQPYQFPTTSHYRSLSDGIVLYNCATFNTSQTTKNSGFIFEFGWTHSLICYTLP